MADRTVRAIFEARVEGARKGMAGLSKDVAGAGKKVDDLTKGLKAADAVKVRPEIDVKIDEAKKRLTDLTRELGDLKQLEATPEVTAKIDEAKKRIAEVRADIKQLTGQKAEVKVDASIKETQKRIRDITIELGQLRTMEVTPEVTADIREAQRRMRDARAELRELNAAKATMEVTADTSPAKGALSDLSDDVADAGQEGGEEAGGNIVGGILDALRTIPIAGAIIGVGVAIAGGILVGIKQGLAIEAERDLFSAQTGLDEDTSARFGRAAGEAYANAWGESVADNLDSARLALQAGIIDSDATDAEIENVIAKLQGLQTLFDYDIQMAVQAVGNAMKTGLVRDADQAFDLIVAASQRVASDDLLDTINEYSNQFVTMGLSAEQAFGLIVQGAEAGARDTDKVADTLKEMGLRIREGTEPAVDALDALGLNAEQIVDDFQNGGPRATRAIDKVFDALRDLERKGGNTQEVIAALFGGPGEDLGAALFALDLQDVDEALGGVEGSAGAAERALTTMSDNTATKIEQAKRNVEIAMDGIKGALAEAFGDDIAGAADWVSKNRGPLLQFFADAFNGVIDLALAMADFGASTLDTFAAIARGLADLINAMPFGIGNELVEELEGVAGSAEDAAATIRGEVPAALEDTRKDFNDWIGPEIMKARVHDATVAMAEDMKAFSAVVDESGGTVEINGVKLNAEEALAELQANINEADGTVTINGDAYEAEDALDVLMALIEAEAGDVKIGADPTAAELEAEMLKAQIDAMKASMKVTADTSVAEIALANLERQRYVTLGVRVAGVNSVGGLVKGNYDGGWIGTTPGRYAGGWVPGKDVGYDNVAWPLYSGGRVLTQPLGGGEMVVNAVDASANAALLEFINSGGRVQFGGGGRPAQPINIERLVTPDARSFLRSARRSLPYSAKARPGRG